MGRWVTLTSASRLKNRIYVGLAFFGDLYLIYVTFMLLKNQSWLRGFLYFLAVVGVTYYLYLNAVYYFLGKPRVLTSCRLGYLS